MLGKFFDWLSNLRPRQLFLLAGGSAIIIFCIIYIGLKSFSNSNTVPMPINIGEDVNEVPQVQMVNVVVANRNIEPKSMVISSMLAFKEMPEDQVPQDAVTDPNEITNKPAKNRILKDSVILHSDIYRNIEQSGFVGSIPPDCRAVSITVSDVTGVAGFAKPGDYVDVLMVENNERTVTSRLILQNVLLLSINKSMTDETAAAPPPPQEGEEGQEVPVDNPATKAIENPALATLALRPDEVLQLVSASKIGEIYLMLRPLVPQGDYYNGAEYSMETLQKKEDDAEAARLAAEAARQQAAQAQQAEFTRQATLRETMIEGKGDFIDDANGSGNGAPVERITIMYGDDDAQSSPSVSSPPQTTSTAKTSSKRDNGISKRAGDAERQVVGQVVNDLGKIVK